MRGRPECGSEEHHTALGGQLIQAARQVLHRRRRAVEGHVGQLDAGLVRDDDAPFPVLAVHLLPLRSDKQFAEIDGRLCADPLECLVAMYDMKLYEPAADMLEELIRSRPIPVG